LRRVALDVPPKPLDAALQLVHVFLELARAGELIRELAIVRVLRTRSLPELVGYPIH
jgi:hypothetical protein